jgi:hypothetical protein
MFDVSFASRNWLPRECASISMVNDGRLANSSGAFLREDLVEYYPET